MLNAINPKVYNEVDKLAKLFQVASPFPHVVIDSFLNESIAENILENFPDTSAMHLSRHYMFGNKYELSPWRHISDCFQVLYEELSSPRFQTFISQIASENLFTDPNLLGAIHQGINGSYLDMHTDFNLHPYNQTWIHSLTVLIYLNKNWQQEYGGDLQLRSKLVGENFKVSPDFNRCVIMLSDDKTYHGYSKMSLPPAVTRKSITVQLYKQGTSTKRLTRKTTTWVPAETSILKHYIAKLYNPLVLTKNRFFGSFTLRKHEVNQSYSSFRARKRK